MLDPRVSKIISLIVFHHEPEYDKVFPSKRLSRVEVKLKNGNKLVSDTVQPIGEKNSDISLEDLIEKIHKINDIYSKPSLTTELIELILNTPSDSSVRNIIASIKELASNNIHPEIKFI